MAIRPAVVTKAASRELQVQRRSHSDRARAPSPPAGYKPGEQVSIALDPASVSSTTKPAATMFSRNRISPRTLSANGRLLGCLGGKIFPSVSIEDGMAEDDWAGWKSLTQSIAAKIIQEKIQLVGDDLFGHQHHTPLSRNQRRHCQCHPH